MPLPRLAAIALCLAACDVVAERPPAASIPTNGPVTLKNGSNPLDLLGDGSPGEVLVSWRGNFNAHGFSVVVLQVRAPSDLDSAAKVWQVLPFFGGPEDGEGGRDVFRTSEGADCMLRDLRIVQRAGSGAEVVLAVRDIGDSYADSAEVRFDFYRVARNADGEVGRPMHYLQFVRSVHAQRRYCDVNEAFARELDLTANGLGHGGGAG